MKRHPIEYKDIHLQVAFLIEEDKGEFKVKSHINEPLKVERDRIGERSFKSLKEAQEAIKNLDSELVEN